MICAERGYHTRKGLSAGTDPEGIVWERSCVECGTDLRGTEEAYSVATLRQLLVDGDDRIEWKTKNARFCALPEGRE